MQGRKGEGRKEAVDLSGHNAYSGPMPPTRQSTAALPLAPAVYLILLALSDADLHGYRLRAEVLERSRGTLKLDPGSLYRLIGRLVDDELIAESPPGARPKDDDERRRYYRLTPRGRRVLQAETDRMADLVALARVKAARRARAT